MTWSQFFFILLVGILICIILYFLTVQPTKITIAEFTPTSTDRLYTVHINRLGNSKLPDLVVLPKPKHEKILLRYNVILPESIREGERLTVEVPSKIRVRFRTTVRRVTKGSKARWLYVLGGRRYQFVSKLEYFRRDQSTPYLQWSPTKIANGPKPKVVPLSPQRIGCQNPDTGWTFLQAAFKFLQLSLNPFTFDDVNNGIALYNSLYNFATDGCASAGPTIADLINALPSILQSALQQEWLDEFDNDLELSLANYQLSFVNYYNIKYGDSANNNAVPPLTGISVTNEVVNGGDPHLLSNTGSCSAIVNGSPVSFTLRETLYQNTDINCFKTGTGADLQTIQNEIVAGVNTKINSLQLFAAQFQVWYQTPVAPGSPNLASLYWFLFLPFLQLVQQYVILTQEVVQTNFNNITAEPTSNPLLLTSTYTSFRENMKLYMPILEYWLFYWKQRVAVTNFTVPESPYSALNLPNASPALQNSNDASGQGFCGINPSGPGFEEQWNAYWCGTVAASFDTGANPPCGLITSKGGETKGSPLTDLALSYLNVDFDANQASWSNTFFNSGLSYWSAVTVGTQFNNYDQAPPDLCAYYINYGSTCRGPQPMQNNAIDYPNDGSISEPLSKYTNTVNGVSQVQNILGNDPGSMFCINNSTLPYLQTTSGPSGPTPQMNEAPADEYPIYNQILLDKFVGNYIGINGDESASAIDTIMAQLYSLAGIIPPSDSTALFDYTGDSVTFMNPVLPLGPTGPQFIPGTFYGFENGTYYSLNNYQYCTPAQSISALGQSCSGPYSNYSYVGTAAVNQFVDGTVVSSLDYPTVSTGCPNGTTSMFTCLKPNFGGTPTTVGTLQTGNLIDAYQPASRILLCQNDSSPQLEPFTNSPLPAVDCDGALVNNDYSLYFGVCSDFWIGNVDWIVPTPTSTVNIGKIGYNMYTFSVSTVGYLPVAFTPVPVDFTASPFQLGSIIQITSNPSSVGVERLAEFMFYSGVTISSGAISGYPVGANNTPINFIDSTSWSASLSGGVLTFTFTAYEYMSSLQRFALAYQNDTEFATQIQLINFNYI